MDKFKFSSYTLSWPDWFDDLVEKGKVQINIDTDPVDWVYIAYLWTPDKIVLAYEGKTILNHGSYCGLEQNGL